tara:strand:- start:123 stop:1367 length:1245 start_codon:yes stop_codon:yes gene_type:complete
LNREKRILLLNQWFEPEPSFKGLLFAKSLISKGYDVEVLTGFPNYPTGNIYPGYKLKLLKKEVIQGVKVTRVFLYPSHDNSSFRRSLNYLSFFLSSLIYGLFLLKRVDIIYAYHPPLTTGLSASLLSIFKRIPLVYDIQDLWPESLKSTGMINSKILLSTIGILCKFVYHVSNQIVVLSPGLKKSLIAKKVNPKKLNVVYNWADEKKLLNIKYPLPNLLYKNKSKSFSILFAGNIGKAQNLSIILAAAKILQERNLPIYFTIIGEGIEKNKLINLKERNNLKNISFLAGVPMEEVGSILCSADCLILHLKDDPLFRVTIPSKLQAYMLVGKPILIGVQGDAENLVKKSQSGIAFKPDNPQSLASASIEMFNMSPKELNQFSQNAKYFYSQELSSNIGIDRFVSIFEKTISNCKQ